MLDRQAAHQQGYAFARRLRDAWLAWPARVAAVMAADLGVDAHRLEVLLDAHVREQLQATATRNSPSPASEPAPRALSYVHPSRGDPA